MHSEAASHLSVCFTGVHMENLACNKISELGLLLEVGVNNTWCPPCLAFAFLKKLLVKLIKLFFCLSLL